jgi:hypothetical protein
MTAGTIASIPFWTIAAFSLYVAIVAPTKRAPGETNINLIGQFLLFLFLSGVFSAVAAAIMRFL